MKVLYETISELPYPQAACAAHYGAEQYKCMMTEYALPFIKAPLFIIESGYDLFKIPSILQSPCTNLANCSADNLEEIHAFYFY